MDGPNVAHYIDSLYNVSNYHPIHSNPVKAIIKGEKAQTQNLQFYVTSFTHRGTGVNLTSFLNSLYMYIQKLQKQ